MISTLLAYAPERAPEALRHYARMKCESDDYLIASGLDYLVLRPGTLTIVDRINCVTVATVNVSTDDHTARRGRSSLAGKGFGQ